MTDLGHVLRRMLDDAHTVPPDQLPNLGNLSEGVEGLRGAQIFLVDYGGRRLMAFGSDEESCPVDGSVGGRVFIHGEPVEVVAEGIVHLWCPLVDGIDRVGVIRYELESLDDERRTLLTLVSSVIATELVTRGQYTDAVTKTRRLRQMSLPAEVQWALLPPGTFSTRDVRVAAALEPSYSVAGDAYDFSYDDHVLRAAVIDAMGHDLSATLLSGLVIGGYRNARRRGATLEETVDVLDRLVREGATEGMFATGVFAELDVSTGDVSVVSAGHPPPLLLRDGHVNGVLSGGRRLPLGLGDMFDREATLAETRLQPDDRLLIYSDGIVEEHSAGGAGFGIDRLSDFIQVQLASGLQDAEIVRRLIHAVVDYYDGQLSDDGTVILLHWNPGALS